MNEVSNTTTEVKQDRAVIIATEFYEKSLEKLNEILKLENDYKLAYERTMAARLKLEAQRDVMKAFLDNYLAKK